MARTELGDTPMSETVYDAVIVGGGPAGSTAAQDLASKGHAVLLLDRAGRIKPCGGAIPPRLIKDFDIPAEQLVARATCARMVSPGGQEVDMPINGGFVGMVDREHFDEFLRVRAAGAGAQRMTGEFDRIDGDVVHVTTPAGPATVRARMIIGADGARSVVAQQAMPDQKPVPCVFAYHEIVRSPVSDFAPDRCDVYYQGRISPDFYGWVFPHGATTSVGVGSAKKGFSLRTATTALRESAHLKDVETVRREGAPLPMKPLKRWDNGRNVVLAGDAAGVVAPASGEGIYYAMHGGRLAADAVAEALKTGDSRALANARRQFMRQHGRVFWILGMMQHFWYSSDKRRERFVAICRDPDVQDLTWQAYMNKELVRARPAAHLRIFFKDLAHLAGFASA
jgi:geranylgeranyl reductase